MQTRESTPDGSEAAADGEPLDLAAVFAALPGVGGIEVLAEDGPVSTLRVGLTPGSEAQSALRAAFLGGLDVRRFQMKEPTLHDAFIALTGDHPDEDQSVSKTDKAGAA